MAAGDYCHLWERDDRGLAKVMEGEEREKAEEIGASLLIWDRSLTGWHGDRTGAGAASG